MQIADKALKSEFISTLERLGSGRITIRTPEGEKYRFGPGGDKEVDIDIHDWKAVSALAAHGQVGMGEAYVQGMWDTSSIEDLLVIANENRDTFQPYDKAKPFNRMKFRLVDTFLRANSRRGSAKNIRSHYDVGNEFYQLWLDEGMTYSSALYRKGEDGEANLALAQSRKNDRVLSQLNGTGRVLEVGCGWGGFAEHAANGGHDVTALTISRAQHAYADSRLDGRADIRLCDYRDHNAQYDNIVSIEMIEAVGERYWPGYFATLKRNLAEGGHALVQAITVRDDYFDTYRTHSDFIRQYVFPGGMLLSDTQIEKQAKAAGLKVEDNFAFGDSYALTCRTWADRLVRQKNRIHALGFSEAFFRNWQYYLEICAAAFAVGQTNVVQVRLTHA